MSNIEQRIVRVNGYIRTLDLIEDTQGYGYYVDEIPVDIELGTVLVLQRNNGSEESSLEFANGLWTIVTDE